MCAAFPAPGCTTSPAGLLMHQQRPVLEDDIERNLLRRHLPIGLHARLDQDLLAPHDLVPPRSWRPSTWTAPASIQPCSRAREYCGSSRASAWSSRRPASPAANPANGYGTRAPARLSEVLVQDSLYWLGLLRREAKERPSFVIPVRKVSARQRARAVHGPARDGRLQVQPQGPDQIQPRGALQKSP